MRIVLQFVQMNSWIQNHSYKSDMFNLRATHLEDLMQGTVYQHHYVHVDRWGSYCLSCG